MDFDFESQYENEWKSLGFYYYNDYRIKSWFIIGSKDGLLKLPNLINDYVIDPLHKLISEHEHYGPDSYLKIVTWHSAQITKDGIFGSLNDIQKLGNLIKDRLLLANTGDVIIIDKEYSDKNEFILVIKIMNDDFDPSKVDA